MEDLALHLDIFGQQQGLYKLYTQLCLCFPMGGGSSQSDIIDTLTKGLERLTASFPWVAGQVLRESPGDGARNIYRIKPFEKTPRLVVKELHDGPWTATMYVLRRNNFPFRMLDESLIAPINTLAAGTDGPAPVFLMQANFITGGLLLTFVTQHNTMDMTGMAQIMYLLSKACHNEPFTAEEVSNGNLDRRNLIPLLDETYEPGPELAYQIGKPPAHQSASKAAEGQAAQPQPPKCSWIYFDFSAASLARLKSQAMQFITSQSGYVSTDDVLSAFIWLCVARARLPRLEANRETTLARAIDPRRYLGIPATYPGLVQNMTYSTYTFERLLNAPLGHIASKLREAIDPATSNLAYATRALATRLHRSPEDNSINVTATLDLSADIMLSSWAKYDCYDLDFNLGLGKPEAVRRPQFVPLESLFYLMPKRPDGEIAVALSLREEDLDRLRKDEEFMKYAVYIG
ncbi:uncharacterized protein A1O5_09945 [Cladophialophora psammophila CBS 110553]|uniref:Trichothecene 3-O-acetyltransferase-like N-terminal domain-containing protein n=1 Tax=Cladophialophora psammophila CBS 110553 TaxID=1182543 RepID=W9WP23_9EURO|nr:uncharacterized protein A1O5_09945 [Cladophialophora psammophila CBS 110553]EXJ66750.1 hypothetical protein A1O5_09945 [Cladophialophora psammophila CBS 110553]